jgi:ABC-type transport system involved in multi-copper enzyme maturation permease subunit
VKCIQIIALKEFRDRLRSGWIVACIFVWLGVISLTSVLGLIQIGQIGVQGYERTTISLLNLVQYLVPLLALLVGHDLVVREREDRTLNLVLASGVRRTHLLLGKFIGGALTIAVPLLLGFMIAGTMIGVAARDTACLPFLKLSCSGLLLGIAFTGIGLLVSTLARARIQALVCALLTWGVAVFAFDLTALGMIVSTRAVQASVEIDLLCDATHVNDIHAAFDANTPSAKVQSKPASHFYAWLWLNPVDVFRALNLPRELAVPVPPGAAAGSLVAWLALSLGIAAWKLERMDL